MHLQPYLIFPGTCREALGFYAECLGGELELLQTYAESPLDLPAEHGERIFHSKFVAKDLRFMASDDLPGQDHHPGNNFSLFVAFSEATEHRRCFEALSNGGKVLMPLQGNFGMLEDRFRNRWMLALEEG